MQPLYIVTEKFSPEDGEKWDSYIAFSDLTQLRELVSLDNAVCPPVLNEFKPEYWPYIVGLYLTDLPFLLGQIENFEGRNLLSVYKNAESPPPPPDAAGVRFDERAYQLPRLSRCLRKRRVVGIRLTGVI